MERNYKLEKSKCMCPRSTTLDTSALNIKQTTMNFKEQLREEKYPGLFNNREISSSEATSSVCSLYKHSLKHSEIEVYQ